AKRLGEASEALGEGMPGEAGRAQQEAATQLGDSLAALNAAAAAAGLPTAQPGQAQTAMAAPPTPGPGTPPGQTPAQSPQPGQGQKPGPQPGKGTGEAQDKHDAKGDGDGDGQKAGENKNAVARGADVKPTDGTFINLQKREREKVRQNSEAAFPAEFRELIKQYNINIKSSTKPAPAGK
ncbi:MAG: hypothetical protein ACRC7O_00255, partial [Fimbriiglobus sp.]